MKFSTEIEIGKPIQKVIELFDNADNLKKWMEGLQLYEHIRGAPGQRGAFKNNPSGTWSYSGNSQKARTKPDFD